VAESGQQVLPSIASSEQRIRQDEAAAYALSRVGGGTAPKAVRESAAPVKLSDLERLDEHENTGGDTEAPLLRIAESQSPVPPVSGARLAAAALSKMRR